MRLILASRSPRRAELLARIGLTFEVCAADVDETPRPGESAEDYVVRLAGAKARAVFSRYAAERPCGGGDVLALGADTAVVVDGDILGKPLDVNDGVDMLLRLSGREHQVVTGVAVQSAAGSRSRLVVTDVRFRAIEPLEAQAYCRTGEGADKAGGYGIQGIGGIFAESVRGSYSAVVGLPLAETEQLLRESGFDTWHGRTHG